MYSWKYLAKRSMLLLPIGALPMLFLFVNKWYVNFYSMSVFSFLSSYIFFMNFPYISKIMHTKSLNYEDLATKHSLDSHERSRYQRIFIRVINIPLALFITALVDYGMFRISTTVLNTQEIIGIIGGLGSTYVSFHEIVGQILIIILHQSKERYNKRKLSTDEDGVELSSIQVHV